ncbi:MAG: DUF928 domain-containing protein [Lyngbya sp. HA4199-MV5]|jgi:hypothetical protein|nr:DUF928 domain-containing protein [Lyngbya sp. HA4199-MV5]
MKRLPQVVIVGTGILSIGLGTVTDFSYVTGNSRDSRAIAQSGYNPPPDVQSAPGNRSQGGRRTIDNCPTKKDEVTALVPETAGNVLGYTVSDHPTLWFYIPFGKERFPKFSFALRLQEESSSKSFKSVLEKPLLVELPSSPGFTAVQIPANLVKIGNRYRWSFQFVCNGEEADGPRGWIERIAKPSALAQVGKLPPVAQADRYIQEKIWYDALTVLGNQRLANPNDQAASDYWSKLLKDIGLDNLANLSSSEKAKAVYEPK